MDLNLSCQCGQVKGKLVGIKPDAGNHVMCMCDDCQTFANYLGLQEKLKDTFGGTEIFQLTPNKVKITQGQQQLAAVKLSPRGLTRFYARCCNTPIANTISHDKAFAGVITQCIDEEVNTKEKALGSITLYWKTEFAQPGLPDSYQPRKAIRPILRILKMFLLGKLFSWHKPNPFFSPETEKPNGEVITLTKEQRQELKP